MKDLLEYIIRSIVDHPDSVRIEEEVDQDIIRLNVFLADEDYPQVIGKQGMTVKSLTDIIRTYNALRTEEDNRIYINVKSDTDNEMNSVEKD